MLYYTRMILSHQNKFRQKAVSYNKTHKYIEMQIFTLTVFKHNPKNNLKD